jgi:hypothetical protein
LTCRRSSSLPQQISLRFASELAHACATSDPSDKLTSCLLSIQALCLSAYSSVAICEDTLKPSTFY